MDKNNIDFELWPAIDIIDGKPVRLTQGDFSKRNEYLISLEEIVLQFETFATGIHVIDLDGAQLGNMKNELTVKKIISKTSFPLQLGGGIRSLEDIERLFFSGVSRVIIGTKAITDPELLKRFADCFNSDRIIISIDVKDDKVMTNGWGKESNREIYEFLASLIKKGFQKFVVTDIRQDGTLKGPSVKLYENLRKRFPGIYLLAAGGVGTLNDLKLLQSAGCNGAIFGKAFYEGMISLQELNQFKNAY